LSARYFGYGNGFSHGPLRYLYSITLPRNYRSQPYGGLLILLFYSIIGVNLHGGLLIILFYSTIGVNLRGGLLILLFYSIIGVNLHGGLLILIGVNLHGGLLILDHFPSSCQRVIES